MLFVNLMQTSPDYNLLFYIQRLALLCILVMTQQLWAAEIQKSEVIYKEGFYSLNFELNIDGQFDKVYTLLTDYENLHQLNDGLLESEVLSEVNNGYFRLRFLVRTCVLIFCFKTSL